MARRSQGGIGTIELAITIPLVLFFAMGCFEFSRALGVHLKLTAVAREIGSAAFRQCGNKSDDGVMQNCMQAVLDNIGPHAELEMPGIVMIASAYRWNPVELVDPPPYHISRAAIAVRNAVSADSRVAALSFGDDSGVPPPAGTPARMLFNHGIVVQVEVWAAHISATAFMQPLFNSLLETDGLYASFIF